MVLAQPNPRHRSSAARTTYGPAISACLPICLGALHRPPVHGV
jgi:hypothetical protein